MTLKIVRYIKTGYLDPFFKSPTLDLSGRLEPDIPYHLWRQFSEDVAAVDICSNDALVSKGIMPPHPSDLAFLSPADFEVPEAGDYLNGYTASHLLDDQNWDSSDDECLESEESEVLEDFDFDSLLNIFEEDDFFADSNRDTTMPADDVEPAWYNAVPAP